MTTKGKQASIYTKNPATQTAAMIDAQAQLEGCRQYCQANSLSVVDEYADDAGKREQFERMTTAVATEGLDIDAIVVWKLNRVLDVPRRDHRMAGQAQGERSSTPLGNRTWPRGVGNETPSG